MKTIFVLLLFLSAFSTLGQQVGNKVTFKAVDGKSYTGIIKEIENGRSKVKYDGFEFESWIANNQFTILNNKEEDDDDTEENETQADNRIGSKVSIRATNGKIYSGTITEIRGEKYKIKYDGFNFEPWLLSSQFSIGNTSSTTKPTYTPPVQQPTTQWTTNNTGGGVQDINTIFTFGKRNGWASVMQEIKLNSFMAKLSAPDKAKLVQFINQAKTNSAKFFVLKSLLAGDDYPVLQKFINQLNQYPENVQQEKCLVTTRKSIIQQWQQTCSVTTVQTFLGELCPRYAWEVKQIANYDEVANDPNHPMAQQQKMLMEKYGGAVSARGSSTGKEIGINLVLNEFVGKILGVQFYAQEVTEPLPTIFGKIRSMLDKGICEPLLIGFGGGQRHFILALKYRQTANGYEYLIYDPWTGVSDYVTQQNLEAGSMAPLNPSWRITLDYYYPVYE